jgi:hypothetical protein
MDPRFEDASFSLLLQQLDELVAVFESHPDERVREQATSLLTGIDALHRAPLERVLEIVRELGGEAAVERLSADPLVRVLLGLYDLVPLDLPDEPAATAGRGRAGVIPLEL